MFNFGASLSAAITTLTNAGLTPANAVNAARSLFGGVKSTVTPMLANIVADRDQPSFVQQQVNQILAVNNINSYPVAVAAIKQLPVACANAVADPTKLQGLLDLVQDIETQL